MLLLNVRVIPTGCDIMHCPYCLSESIKVIDKRPVSGTTNWRRRECLNCTKRFTTYESVEPIKIKVLKKNGQSQNFDKNKIVNAIIKSRSKKTLPIEKIEQIADSIERELLSKNSFNIISKDIGELILKQLKIADPIAYIRFASVFKEYTDVSNFETDIKELKVKRTINTSKDTTDLYLQVTSNSEEINDWDREKIVQALLKETTLSEWQARDISKEVEKKLFSSKISLVNTTLVREIVNNELFQRGFNEQLNTQKILGMPSYNILQVIMSKNKDNANIKTNNPEAINLAIAGNVLKQFALSNVFSKEVANAHLKGAIHLHNLDYITRVYCGAHSPEFIKKYGIKDQLTLSTTAGSAKHASVLTGHILTFIASMQPYYAGALGLSYLNIFYAPLLVGKSYEQMKQEAQALIFGIAQGAFSRGGQTIFCDFNIHLGIPSYFKDVPAIGPGGKYTGKTYGEYEKEAQMFAKALLAVWRKGDSQGKVFPFPKCDLHVNQEAFDDPVQKEILLQACEIAGYNGSPYFIFDRDQVTLSACCRLKEKVEDPEILKHPESIRFCGFQVVTTNLPQCAYKAGKGNIEGCIKEIYKTMDIVVKAHLEKKAFTKELMSSPGMPLWQIGKISADGKPYVDIEKSTYIFGLIGLNECVKFLTEESLHSTEQAYKLGLKIISSMYLRIKEYEKKYGLKFSLEETPAEGCSLRFAKLDLKNYPESRGIVRGEYKKSEVYYTNSIHFEADADIDIFERIEKQGKFNSLIESGSITHIFIGEYRPSKEAIYSLLQKTWEKTQSSQITISPEFTVCNDCGKISEGYKR
jgi:ribonucleoside-triphosphate reductase (formate)